MLNKVDGVIYPADWASGSAQKHYKVPERKISVLPFGPNIPDALINKYYAPKSAKADERRIVFVSADWIRKSGDLTVEICRLLKQDGMNVRLVTIGSTPDHIKKFDFVQDHGFLRKSNPDELVKLCEAYRDAHFMVLP